MNKSRLFVFGMLLVFALGLFLPDLFLLASDWHSVAPVVTSEHPAEYEYTGTPENRIRAFTAYENASPHVRLLFRTEAQPVDAFPVDIAPLFPEIPGGSIVHAAFALAPNGMNARFAFEEYILTSGGVSIRMVADAETGRPVLITMTGGRDILSGEEMNRYALARAYVNVLGYGDISDLTGGSSYGASVITEKFDVRGVPFGISVTVSPAAGILSYRLTNSGE